MGTVGIIIIVVIVLVVIFLILREVNCWYWKINERISLMNDQNELLRVLISGSKYQDKDDLSTGAARVPSDSKHIICVKCNQEFEFEQTSTGNVRCPHCSAWNSIPKF